MDQGTKENLWIDFPKPLPEFEKRFPDEAVCYDYLMDLRLGGESVCAHCGCHKSWKIQERKVFEYSQ